MAQTDTMQEQAVDDRRMQEISSAEELLGEPEPWESWETQLILYSIGIALVGLVGLGWLVNTFILN